MLSMTNIQLPQFSLNTLQHLWIGGGFDFLRIGAMTVGAEGVLAADAIGGRGGRGFERRIGGVGLRGEDLGTFMAGEFGGEGRVGAWCVAGIAVWVLLLLGGISRTINTTHMLTTSAQLRSAREQGLANTTITTNALSRLLSDQRLRTRLAARLGELDLLTNTEIGVDLDGTSCTRRLLALLVGLLEWVTRALLAPRMLAFGTYLVGTESGVALVTGAMDAHADGFLDTESGFVLVGGQEGLDGNLEFLAQLADSFGVDFGALDPGRSGSGDLLGWSSGGGGGGGGGFGCSLGGGQD
jgi:hypothetical protein